MSRGRATPELEATPREDGPRLSGLWVYPIKSAGGVALEASPVEERGLRYDRRWMVVDGDGRFVSQREHPRMALIWVRIEPDHLAVEAPGMPPLEVPLRAPEGQPTLTSVQGDLVEALPVGDAADRWFGEYLGAPRRLVNLPDASVRPVDGDYGRPGDHVSLADAFPFLLISEASLEDLNARLERPLPMDRFRPNFVVSGCEPFAEDGWRRVRVGGLTFRVAKPCPRCKIVTVDQQTGDAGKEPLRTLASFRKGDNGVLFGQYLVGDSTGTLSVGDPVEVLRYA